LKISQIWCRSKEKNKVVHNIETGNNVVEQRTIDATTGNGVIPVFGNRPTCYDAGTLAEDGVDAQPNNKTQEDLLCSRSAEDTPILAKNRQLDGELSEVVGDNGAP
jgi:hypothetical protein